MDDVTELINNLGVLIAVIGLSLYGVLLWAFHSFGQEIVQLYSNYRIQNVVTTYFSQQTSLILPLVAGYIFAVFYLSGSDYFRDNTPNYPKSHVLMEIAKSVQFTMPIYIASLIIAIRPSSNTLLVGILGLSLYAILMSAVSILVEGRWYNRLIIGLATVGCLYLSIISESFLVLELVIMGLLTIYIHLVHSATDKYYTTFTRNYESVAKNYLNVKNSTQVWLDTQDHITKSTIGNKERENRELADKLKHVIVSALSRAGLIKGGNFVIVLILLSIIYALNLSVFALVYLLAVYPLTVVRIPLLEYSPKGPVKFIGSSYEGVFITDENDQEGYYIIITPEGEKKVRADSIDGYEVYNDDEEAREILEENLDG